MTRRTWIRLVAGTATAAVLALGVGAAAPAPAGADAGGSRCEELPGFIACSHETTAVLTAPLGTTAREVHWQVPLGEAPADGWPAVVVYSPSLWSAAISWAGSPVVPLGPYHQTRTYKELLDRGFAVITPEAHLGGYTFWDTNNVVVSYELSADNAFVKDLLAEIGKGTFGPVNPGRLFATGMSSGGYMTSRMAVSHAGSFQALAVQSASYAPCFWLVCSLPEHLPDNHPPTLFLHGGLDPIVPISTMYAYRDALEQQGIPTKTVVDDPRLHEFLPVAPEEIADWFQDWDPGQAPDSK